MKGRWQHLAVSNRMLEYKSCSTQDASLSEGVSSIIVILGHLAHGQLSGTAE